MKVFGLKEMVIEKEQSLGNGVFVAGISHLVAFVMEPLTHKNWKFWHDYAGYMKTCAKGSVHQTQTDIAIKGFTNALELIDSASAAVFVVYSTLDVSTTEADNVMKMINIQMCMTVTTSASIPYFPVVTHMGIFRSPLLSQDLGKLDGALGEIKSVLSKQPEFYKDKPAKAISLVLHSFAARAIMTISNGHQAKLMITAPVEHMGGLLSEVGKIFVEEIVPKSPKSNLNTPLLTMSRPSLSSPGILPRRSVASPSKDPTTKIGATPNTKDRDNATTKDRGDATTKDRGNANTRNRGDVDTKDRGEPDTEDRRDDQTTRDHADPERGFGVSKILSESIADVLIVENLVR